ncbi:MAG TPA: DUF192 domain-containing protein [Burkholderiales bacterium]|nr:DUF192 domain-containing protein [Burkholderiales bacterium]
MGKKRRDKGKSDPALDISDISRVYRADTGEQPPQRLDAAILSQARQAVNAPRAHGPFGSGWTMPLSAAAVVLLSVGVVVYMAREAPLQPQALSESVPSEIYSSDRQHDPARRGQPQADAKAVPPPAAPAPEAQAPLVAKSQKMEKKESRVDTTTATGPAGAMRDRAEGAAAAPGAAAEDAGNRSARPFAKQQALRVIELQVGNRIVRAELASTSAELERGLMYRERLAPDSGMLFVFPRNPSICMWMKDTKIPLSAAFIDRNGIVLRIADMQPMSEKVHCAEGDVRFVLEVNQGDFTAARVKPGARIGGLPPLAN